MTSIGFEPDAEQGGIVAVIPPKADRNRAIPCDLGVYEWRHLIENVFCSLKAFRRIGTRYEKTDTSFSAVIYAASSVLALQ